MANYKITCSSTCDLTAEHLKALDCAYIKFHYIIDGVEYPDDLFTTCSVDEFYGKIKDGALPTTSQITPAEAIEVFEPILKEGYDLLHIEFSSGLSGSYNSSLAAKAELEKKYPERKIYVIDSLAASSGYGLLVDKAVELKNSGMNIDELAAWIEENKLRVRHWVFTSDLAHLKRGGRVSGAAAAIGSLLKICPVIDVNSMGKLIVRKKALGKKKAKKIFAELICEQAEGGVDYVEKCYISHSLAANDAMEVAKDIEESFKNIKGGKVLINNIGTVIGSHTGVGTIALFYFSKDKREL